MNITVIHHSADNDGIFSGLICKYFLEKGGNIVSLYPFNYGEQLDYVRLLSADLIYMVDISHDILNDPNYTNKIVWIDHHKTAIEKYNPLISGLRIDGVAACRLCWQMLSDGYVYHPKEEYIARQVTEPTFIRLAGEYDVWDKRDPEADLFNLGSYIEDKEILFNRCLNDSLAYREYISAGYILQKYNNKNNASICKANVHVVKFAGLTFACLNTARGNSLSFQGLEDTYDAYMMWRWDGSKVTVSLYHAPGHEQHDLSTIAKKFNGGGHKGACGFITTLSDMSDILHDKQA